MSSAKPPAFQFYARDWLADAEVRQLRLDERGAYVDLLAVQWNEGEIPSECDAAGMCIGIHPDTWPEWRSRIWPRVLKFFHNGRNPRLEDYRKSLEKARKAASKRGKHAAASRWKRTHIDAARNASASSKHNTASATASASAVLPPDVVPSLRSETTGGPGVENLIPDIGKAARALHPDRDQQKRIVAWAKKQRSDQVALDRLRGLALMRDHELLTSVEPAGPIGVQLIESQPNLMHQAEAYWHKYAPRGPATKGLVAL